MWAEVTLVLKEDVHNFKALLLLQSIAKCSNISTQYRQTLKFN